MRILVADDYADWRAKVRVIVGYRPQWQIIDEACDGEEAVEKAAQLKPDIVILDLSMPRLNGIEAAKLIQQRSSSTRVVSAGSSQRRPRLRIEEQRSQGADPSNRKGSGGCGVRPRIRFNQFTQLIVR